MDRLLTFFGIEYGKDEVERDVYPMPWVCHRR
jgi:hypothetical protein